MRLLDLFAGIGGFSLAAHWMGWQTSAFVEKEPFCQKVLRKNFGDDIEIHNDIFEFDGRPFRGAVDIITGGFPCQPFSAAGKRKGRADERHLFPQMLRVISEVRPRWVVAENVRGLLSIESGAVFAEVVASLEGEGYEVITFCVPASAVEAPHRRDRLWIVAHAIDRPFGESAISGGDVENAFGFRRDGKQSENASDLGRQRQFGSGNGERLSGWSEPWIEAATRLCRVDDGVSDRVHGTGGISTEPKNKTAAGRVHRLKALGNSIVPQIAFEIFKAIEETE